jgi:hypothetical protein
MSLEPEAIDECECEGEGCPTCDSDLSTCDECGQVESFYDLDDGMICKGCLEDREDHRQRESDYRHSVL